MEGRGSPECGLRKPKRGYREPKLINSEMAVEWENVRLFSLNRKKTLRARRAATLGGSEPPNCRFQISDRRLRGLRAPQGCCARPPLGNAKWTTDGSPPWISGAATIASAAGWEADCKSRGPLSRMNKFLCHERLAVEAWFSKRIRRPNRKDYECGLSNDKRCRTTTSVT